MLPIFSSRLKKSGFIRESIRNSAGLVIGVFETDSKYCFFRKSIRNFFFGLKKFFGGSLVDWVGQVGSL